MSGGGGGDRLGALPDNLVQHVLSFLPSRDAVKSAALSRRWRHLWRSTPAVRVDGSGDNFRLFVNSLLLHRGGTSPLLSFEMDADLLIGDYDSDYDEDYDRREVDPHVDLWISLALSTCRARSLTARFGDERPMCMWSPRRRIPFASPYLTTMCLHGVELAGDLLDFSCFPALLHLRLTTCRLDGHAFVSPSLERLSVIDCHISTRTYYGIRGGRRSMRISTPSLRCLQLHDNYEDNYRNTSASLESMPLLTNASIHLTGSTNDDDGSADARSLLLHGLSEATRLELIASSSRGRIILQRDLTWCPTFSKLKTLILNEWCVYDDVAALVCLLRHMPRLESLILKLHFRNDPTLEVETEERHITSEQSIFTFEHLKTVEIENIPYDHFPPVLYFDTRVDEILELFNDWGIPSSKISIN